MSITRLGLTGTPASAHKILGQPHLRIYRGQDGAIDYGRIVAVMDSADTQISLVNQVLLANTIWHYVRRAVNACGLESSDATPATIIQIDANGDAYFPPPNTPTDLTATPKAAGVIQLRWRYSPRGQAAAPVQFNVYQVPAGQAIDYDTPTATVTVSGVLRTILDTSWQSAALVHGQAYDFVVRSQSAAGGQSRNTNRITAISDTIGPAAANGLTVSQEVIT